MKEMFNAWKMRVKIVTTTTSLQAKPFPHLQCWFSKVPGTPLICFLLFAEMSAWSYFGYYTCQWHSTANGCGITGKLALLFAQQNASPTQLLLCHPFRVWRRYFNLCSAFNFHLLGSKTFFRASCFHVYGWMILTEKIFKQQLFLLLLETWSYRPSIWSRAPPLHTPGPWGKGWAAAIQKSPYLEDQKEDNSGGRCLLVSGR